MLRSRDPALRRPRPDPRHRAGARQRRGADAGLDERRGRGRTLETGRVTYWSRSRQALWIKGETSGHVQELVELRVDCDRDCLLAVGAADRAGLPHRPPSCFYTAIRDGAETELMAPEGRPSGEADQPADVLRRRALVAVAARSREHRRAWQAAGRPRRGSAGGGARPAAAGRAGVSRAWIRVASNRSSPRTTWVMPWRVVDDDRQVVGRRAPLAGQHHVADRSGQRVRVERMVARDAAGRSRRRSAARPRRRPAPCRAEARRRRDSRTEADRGRCRDRSARPGRGSARPPAVRRPRPRCRAGCTSRDRSGPSRRAGRAPRETGRPRATAASPARASRGRASGDRRSPSPRIRAATGSGRYRRCAAEISRPSPGQSRRPSAPSRRGRDAGDPWARARSAS